MKPKNDFITVDRINQDHKEIYFVVRIDTFSAELEGINPVMIAIAEAVKEYVAKECAKEIYEAVREKAVETISKEVQQEIDAQALKIVKSLDMTAIANIASIGAAKRLGAEIAK